MADSILSKLEVRNLEELQPGFSPYDRPPLPPAQEPEGI